MHIMILILIIYIIIDEIVKGLETYLVFSNGRKNWKNKVIQ